METRFASLLNTNVYIFAEQHGTNTTLIQGKPRQAQVRRRGRYLDRAVRDRRGIAEALRRLGL